MPKSKRDKVVSTSKTLPKGRAHKEGLVNSIRTSFNDYKELYVFEFENMRNNKFKEFREDLKGSCRFFLGSNKVTQVALGKDEADEIRPGTAKISELVIGDRGVVFTNLPREEISRRFEEFEERDFARVGSIATETVELPEGPLEQFTHDMEPFLRKQGLPVRLLKGVVELIASHTICTEGEPISPEASRMLRLLGNTMAVFRLKLVARWTPEGVENLSSGFNDAEDGSEGELVDEE
eukprot:TRINITY_DN19512_c0_g1_i2.p1 TRINITY_DN19512_c0_g1~~TRINITY_DN19512_c0_g1_i2.p1  ORF type:complete len:237 (-),score=41.39 TRINITY_DN19512_c0_g1_i2:470-1180(-)